jgi:hypothetical protein
LVELASGIVLLADDISFRVVTSCNRPKFRFGFEFKRTIANQFWIDAAITGEVYFFKKGSRSRLFFTIVV